MHPGAYDFVRSFTEGRAFASVVEVGSRDINGSVRPLFGAGRYWGIDLRSGPSVDEVADAAEWVADPPADCVVCCEVLEHAPHLDAILANIARSLKPGGWFVMTCATDPRAPHSALDGGAVRGGEHYQNINPVVFQKKLADLDLIVELMEVHSDRGDLYTIARRSDTQQKGSDAIHQVRGVQP